MGFHTGNKDGRHYWLTPPELMKKLVGEFYFDFDPCPFPLPQGFDGLTCDWGHSNYVNPPFGSIIHNGKKKGPTAWARKAIEENKKGKGVVLVYPIPKWVLMLIESGAEVRNLGDVRWLATEDGKAGRGIGQHIACFILRGKNGRYQFAGSFMAFLEKTKSRRENGYALKCDANSKWLPAYDRNSRSKSFALHNYYGIAKLSHEPGIKIMIVKLFTRDGRFVCEVEILNFQILPEIVLWGARYFTLKEGTKDYYEGIVTIAKDKKVDRQ